MRKSTAKTRFLRLLFLIVTSFAIWLAAHSKKPLATSNRFFTSLGCERAFAIGPMYQFRCE